MKQKKLINIQSKLRDKFLKKGVKMIAPDTVFFSKNTKTMDFEYVLCENHDFVGSGSSFSELFRTRIIQNTTNSHKSAQVTIKIKINSLRDALGGAWGRKH